MARLNPLTETIAFHIVPLRILIVETDPGAPLWSEDGLGAYPQLQVIHRVTDGHAGIEAALKFKPDLVIMDIHLPKLDGISALKTIRAALPNTRIVLLTAHQTETEAIASLLAGANAYCIKGATMHKLLVVIAAIQNGAVYLDPHIARRVLDQLKPPAFRKLDAKLSGRELEVLQLLVEGRSNPEIAATLFLSLSTVKAHIRNIMTKLAVEDRVQVAVMALRAGLVKV